MGFCFLDGARVDSFEEDAGTVLAFLERKTLSGWPQAGVFLDELEFTDFQKLGNGRNVRLCQPHHARPAATVATAHTLVSRRFHCEFGMERRGIWNKFLLAQPFRKET